MKTYLVGGSVRDELLGLPVKDHDYVVVGASPEEMELLGYRPVGKDFPVFLHPQTNEQYALARTERKISLGYKGFEVFTSPQVTLLEDLARRDITINSIAKSEDGKIIDPFTDGKNPIQNVLYAERMRCFGADYSRSERVVRCSATGACAS